MHEMHEVRIHGRGGQGAVLACSILAQALIDGGKHAVAIPSFGFERRGAIIAEIAERQAVDTSHGRQTSISKRVWIEIRFPVTAGGP